MLYIYIHIYIYIYTYIYIYIHDHQGLKIVWWEILALQNFLKITTDHSWATEKNLIS